MTVNIEYFLKQKYDQYELQEMLRTEELYNDINNRYLKIGGTYDLVYNMSVNMGESKGMKVLNVLNIVILLTICHFAFGDCRETSLLRGTK